MKRDVVVRTAAAIVIFYLSNGNQVHVRDMGPLVRGVCDALHGRSVRPAAPPTPEPERGRWKPAIPVRRSVRHDALICLVCGKARLTLRRHLGVAHGLSPER